MKPFRLTRRTLHHGLCLLTPVWLPETQQGTLPFTLTGDRSDYFRLHMATASSVHCLTWKIPNSAGTHNCSIYKYLKPKTIKTLNPKRKTSNPKTPPPPKKKKSMEARRCCLLQEPREQKEPRSSWTSVLAPVRRKSGRTCHNRQNGECL